MSPYVHVPGSGLEVPGVEAVFEYGDASKYQHGGIPGALRINDRSNPDHVHVSDVSGLHDDPDVSDSRTERAGHYGERAGIVMPRGRTVGVTGYAISNSVYKMRDLWRRMRAQFGRTEKDLIVYPPNLPKLYINEVAVGSIAGWSATMPGATVPAATIFTDGFNTGIQQTATGAPASTIDLTLTAPAIPWAGEDVWIAALVRVPTQAGPVTSIQLGATFAGSAVTWTATGTGIQTIPASSTYYLLTARMSANVVEPYGATQVIPRIVLTTLGTAGSYTIRAARVAVALLTPTEASPAGPFDGGLPGFEYEGVAGASRSYGPCFQVNQCHDPDSTTTALWANDSTAGTTESVSGALMRTWAAELKNSLYWNIFNPNTTSRTLAIRSPATLADPNLYVVAGGRSYRVHVRMLVREMFTAGNVGVVWLNQAGTIISTSVISTFAAQSGGSAATDVRINGTAAAPATAVRAYLRIYSNTPSTVSNNRLSMQVSEPRFFDVSDYDPGDVAIDATTPPEHGLLTPRPSRVGPLLAQTPAGARRRIPRPFLLRKMRSLWDGKAPESQRGLQARRDFTMSLRSSDPRTYMLDQRHSQLRLSGAQSLISSLMSAFRTLLLAPWTAVANDAFTSTTAGGALNARTAPLGGAWTTSGDATDFSFIDGYPPYFGGEQVWRSTNTSTSGRYAILGTTNYAKVEVGVSCSVTSFDDFTHYAIFSDIARYVDASNHLRGSIRFLGSGSAVLEITQILAGVPTTVTSDYFGFSPVAWYRVVLRVYTGGLAVVQVLSAAGTEILSLQFTNAALATGGALATGKVGIHDFVNGAPGAARIYDDFTAATPIVDSAGALTNFTLEGSSIGSKTVWKPNELGINFPLDGVGLGPSEEPPPVTGYLTQDSLARMYYSAGSLTYTTPQVTVIGSPIRYGTGVDYNIFSSALIGGAWQYNYIGALLKRISSTTWIEARFNSAHNAQMTLTSGSPTPPYTLELWSSHNAAGTLATTRLGFLDIPVTKVTDGERKHLRTYMDATGIVYVELWDPTGPNISDVGLIARFSYTLPGPLSTLYGPAVAGRTGIMAKIARWDDGTSIGIDVAKMMSNYGSPYISGFETIDFALALQLLSCPVIGDADDIPLSLQVRGGMVDPTISIANLSTGGYASLALVGTFTDADPVTVDMDTGTIVSASGVNYFSRRQLGSHFFSLAPGQNILTLQAVSWDSAALAHLIATWRDAVK